MNLKMGDRNESSPYSNNFGYNNGGLSTIPAKSKYSSKLETYDNAGQHEGRPSKDSSQLNMNDDFLDKMMN